MPDWAGSVFAITGFSIGLVSSSNCWISFWAGVVSAPNLTLVSLLAASTSSCFISGIALNSNPLGYFSSICLAKSPLGSNPSDTK